MANGDIKHPLTRLLRLVLLRRYSPDNDFEIFIDVSGTTQYDEEKRREEQHSVWCVVCGVWCVVCANTDSTTSSPSSLPSSSSCRYYVEFEMSVQNSTYDISTWLDSMYMDH